MATIKQFESRRLFAPHWHSQEVLANFSGVTLMAMLPLLTSGVIMYGLDLMFNAGLAVVSAGVCEILLRSLAGRRQDLRNGHTTVLAMHLVLSLPPQCPPSAVIAGACLFVGFKELFGGLGHYLWHPMLMARALIVLLMPHLMDGPWAVLDRSYLCVGELEQAAPRPANVSWFQLESDNGQHAWASARPIDTLTSLYTAPVEDGTSARESLTELIRDRMVPAADCILGTAGACVGEACVLAVLVGGLFLVFRGYVHWTLPAGVLIGAAITAAWLPIPSGVEPGGKSYWPLVMLAPTRPSMPIGLLLVLYHFIAGELVFATFFVASDTTSSPLRSIGHLWFGIGIGVLAVGLRTSGLAGDSAYWAILIMNTLVPVINALTRRRVFGT